VAISQKVIKAEFNGKLFLMPFGAMLILLLIY